MGSKKPSESSIDYYPLEIFPSDLNSRGTVFGGRVMALMDKVAAYAAVRHAECEVVTLFVDSVRFLAPAKQGEMLLFKSCVNNVWGTSIEVGVKVTAEDLFNKTSRHVLSAYLTFVAVNENGKPVPIKFKLDPQTPDEIRRFQEAEARRQRRLAEKIGVDSRL